MLNKDEVVKMSGNTVYFWLDLNTGGIFLKAVDFGDPVELTAEEAREIGKKLIEMADKLDANDLI